MRIARLLPLLGLLLLSWPGRSNPAGPQEIERLRAPVSGVEMTVFRDRETGQKWIEDPDGRRYPDVREVAWQEMSRLGDPASRIEATIRARLEDSGLAGEAIPVVLVLREQPLHDVAEDRRPALREDLDRILSPAREIRARIEDRLPPREARARLDPAEQYRLETAAMTAAEEETVRQALRAARERVRRFREEVLAEAAPRCEASRRPVLARLEGVEVHGVSDLLDSILVTITPSRLPALLGACPEIWSALPLPVLSADLDNSVPSIGASSFWTGGSTGSGVIIAVLDSGMDNQHPSIKSAITSESVFLTYGKSASDFSDDSTTTDDLHGHGTHVAGTAAGQDSTYTGVAKAASLVNGKCFFKTTSGNASGDGRDIFNATAWAVTRSDVFSLSFGGSGGDGDSAFSRLYDAVVHDLGLPVAVAAGNSGSSSGTIESPGDAFNVVTAGAYDDRNTTTASDDVLASFSSRGPTSDGRRKPTLSAPGVGIVAPNAAWEGSSPDFVSKSGTSMATPHVAGAIALVLDAESGYSPQAVKALLVNTSRNTSPYPTSPDSNWGWGGLDLSAAYAAHGDVIEGTLTSSGATSLYYTRSTSLSSGDRATLVWNRHVTYSSSSWPGTSPAPTDLDLYLYDGSDGSEKVTSTSSVGPVEQVKAGGAIASPVLRVARSGSFPSGVGSEAFALAHPSGFSLANPPSLSCSFGSLSTPVGPGATFDVTVTVSNSGDLAAISPSVTLTLPSGWTLQSGTSPRTISGISASGTGTATFSVKAPTSTQSGTFRAQAESVAFGGTFTSSEATASQQVDATPPSGTVTIAGGATWTGSSSVTLTLSASDGHSGVARMQFSNDGTTWGSWESYATGKTWTLASGDGTRTAYVRFEDGVGNVSSAASDSISVDTTAPAGSVSIASGAAWTATTSVTLTLAATDGSSGVSEMRLSPDGSTWGSWETYSTSRSWTLATGDGTKTAHAQFRDAVGNVSSTASDTIGLDTTAPTASVVIESGAAWSASSTVSLAISASDGLSGAAEMRFSNDGSTWSAWESLAAGKGWTLLPGDGSRTVSLQVRDAAGNVSSTSADSIGVDATAPSGTVSIQSGAAWMATTSVTLTLAATDGGSGVAEMRLSPDGSTWGSWETYSTSRAWTLATGDGTKTAYAQFRDAAGNVSSAASDTIGLDTTAPAASVVIDSGAAWTATTSVTLTLAGSDGGSGVSGMRLSPDGSTWGSWESYSGSKAWTIAAGDGTKTAYAQFRDVAGNVSSAASDTIVLDTTAPAASVSIAGGAAWVTAPEVQLDVAADDSLSGVAGMRLSEDGASWGAWTSFSATGAWTFSGTDGMKRVHVQVRDAAGNVAPAATDSVGLDRVAPSGTILVAGGSPWTRSSSVAVSPTAADATSGVADMAFSTDGTTWTGWRTFAAADSVVLPAGDGTKTVSVRFRDAAGNVSSSASDSIALDTTPPSGTLVLEGGRTSTNALSAAYAIAASDAGSGVPEARFSSDGTTWGDWTAFAPSGSRALPAGEGTRSVFLRLRDGAGNESATIRADILVDRTAPTAGFTANDGAPYVLPVQDLVLDVDAADEAGGSGGGDFKVSFDGGSSWSAWYGLAGGPRVVVDRPSREGALTATVVVRDAAGNDAAPAEHPVYLVESSPRAPGPGAKVAGTIPDPLDVDTVAIDVARGDLLSVKLKVKADAKGEELRLGLDVWTDSGALLLEARLPNPAKKIQVKSLEAPVSGRYLLVVHRTGGTAPSGTYTLQAKVKQAKANRAPKADLTGGVARFEAAAGSAFQALVRGEGLTAAAISLVGPQGSVPLAFKEKTGKVKVLSTVLPATGTWEIRVDGVPGARYAATVSLPARPKGVVPE